MARSTYEGWMTEEKSSKVIQHISQNSAVEAEGRHETMTTEVKSFNRMGRVDVDIIAKGAAYGEDTNGVDDIEIKAVKFGRAIRIAEEDLEDSPTEIIGNKKLAWASSYAVTLDNAALGTTAAKGAGVPFTSVYKAVRSNDDQMNYVADTNYIASGGAITYDDLVDFLAVYEDGDFADPANTVIFAHPSFKSVFRKLRDDNGELLFQKDVTGATAGTLLDYRLRYTRGARATATASASALTPGNPLLIVGNRDLLIVGDRTQPESIVIDGRSGLSALTDETILKMRARKAVGVGTPAGFAVLEKTAA